MCADRGGPCMQDAGAVEAMPSVQQHHHDMPSQLIAAQYMPESCYQQQVTQQPLPPTEARQSQFPSRLPKPPSVFPRSQVEVTQSVNSSGVVSQDQSSDRQGGSQQQCHVPPAASSGMSNGCDQYEALRLQSSLIPRQSQSSLAVPSQSQMSPVPYQAVAQPQFVQSVTHKSAFAASAISYQTPQAVSAAQAASQRDSVTIRQSAGPAMTASRHQERQDSMHHQLNAGGVAHGSDAVGGQGQSMRAEQEQPFFRQQPAMLDRQVQDPYGTQGQGFMPEQQQPYSVAAMHQQGFTEHTVSRSPDGSSTTKSHTVASSSSHHEFSFRRGIPSSALPRPGTSCSITCCTMQVHGLQGCDAIPNMHGLVTLPCQQPTLSISQAAACLPTDRHDMQGRNRSCFSLAQASLVLSSIVFNAAHSF